MFSVPTYSLMQQSFLRQMQVNGQRHNCDVCEKSFSSVYSLGRHKQMFHVQGKTNCCRECGKSFFNSYLLKRHLLSHSSDRPFICPVCGKTYKYKHDLKNHCLAHANWGHPACCVINFCKTPDHFVSDRKKCFFYAWFLLRCGGFGWLVLSYWQWDSLNSPGLPNKKVFYF